MTAEEQYTKSVGTIMSRAKSWHNPSRLIPDFQDLVSIGHTVFMKCLNEYDPEQGACFNTFLYSSLNWEFYNACVSLPSRLKNSPKAILSLTDWAKEDMADNSATNPEKYSAFKECLENLSDEAKYAVHLLLDTPKDFLDHILKETGAARVTQRRLQRYLKDQGWGWKEIWATTREIKEALNYV